MHPSIEIMAVPGSGLISRRFARAHAMGGHHAASQPGKGSVMTLTFNVQDGGGS
jgi:hypothetical protein